MRDPLGIEGGASNHVVVYPPTRTDRKPHRTTKHTKVNYGALGSGAARPRLRRGITAAAIEARNRRRKRRRFA